MARDISAHELIDDERREMKRARMEAASRIVAALIVLRNVKETDGLTADLLTDRALEFVDAIERKI